MPNFKDVVSKYSNEYFRHLVIEHHICEIFFKYQRALAEDKTPLQFKPLKKELADMAILLEMHRIHDKEFAGLVRRRKYKFVGKLKKELEEDDDEA